MLNECWRPYNECAYKTSSICGEEMKVGSFSGGDDSEHISTFVEIFRVFQTQNSFIVETGWFDSMIYFQVLYNRVHESIKTIINQ